MTTRFVAAVAVSVLAFAAVPSFGQAQNQSFFDQVPGSATSVVIFDRYSGSQPLQKVELRAQAVVKVRFRNDIMSGLPAFNLYSTLNQVGLIGLAPGPVAPVDAFLTTPMSLTDSSDGGPVAEVQFIVPEVLTTYTDPTAIDQFFRGSGTFSYQAAVAANSSVDSFVYTIIGTSQQPEVTVSMGVDLRYFPIPEPTMAGVIIPAGMLLARRARRKACAC